MLHCIIYVFAVLEMQFCQYLPFGRVTFITAPKNVQINCTLFKFCIRRRFSIPVFELFLENQKLFLENQNIDIT